MRKVIFETRICPKSLTPEGKSGSHLAYKAVDGEEWLVCIKKKEAITLFPSRDHTSAEINNPWGYEWANIYRDHCVYYGNDEIGYRRRQDRIVRINGLMMDFDSHSADDMPLEEIGKILLSEEFQKEVPYKTLVMTGNGYQLHFGVGISMGDEDRKEKLKACRVLTCSLMRYFKDHWKLQPDEACKDPNRNYRKAGTWNTKAVKGFNDKTSRKNVQVVKKQKQDPSVVEAFCNNIRAKYPEIQKKVTSSAKTPSNDQNDQNNKDDIPNALSCIDPAALEYQDWLSIGMALHSCDDVEGLELWDNWSSRDAERYDSIEIDTKWSSFYDGGVTVGTLFHIAKEHGYKPKRKFTVWSLINYYEISVPQEKGEDRIVKVARPWKEVSDRLRDLSDGRIINCMDYLYAQPEQLGDEMIDVSDPTKFFAWLGAQCDEGTMGWSHKVNEGINEAKAFTLVSSAVDSYKTIESAPHYPKMQDCYYNHPELPAPDYEALNSLLDKFRPKTQEDKVVILAMFLSVVWGGGYGGCPAFVITSSDGKGVGKSTLAYKIAELIKQTALDGSTKVDMETFRTRLLSTEGMKKRIVVFDNETGRVDSDALAQMITGKAISGKRMYKGEGERPNNLIWIITLNTTHLSGDLSTRSVPINLVRPESYHSTKLQGLWEQETCKIIEEHRYGILAALMDMLKKDNEIPEINIRFTPWACEVLSKACDYYNVDYAVLEKSILSMQNENDSDLDEVLLIEEKIRNMIDDTACFSDNEMYFLPNSLVAGLYMEATGKRCNRVTALRELKDLIRIGKIEMKEHRMSSNRGFLYGDLSQEKAIIFDHNGGVTSVIGGDDRNDANDANLDKDSDAPVDDYANDAFSDIFSANI